MMRDSLHDMEIVAGDFPVVTSDGTGLNVLRQWVRKFFAAYMTHSTVLRTLSSANAPGELFSDGLQLFFSLTEAMTTGMTAAAAAAGRHQENASHRVRLPDDAGAGELRDQHRGATARRGDG